MDFVPTHEVLGGITVDTVSLNEDATFDAVAILDLIDDGRLGLSRTPVVLRRAVEHAFNSVNQEFDADLTWSLVIDDLGSQLFADKECLVRAFTELIRNAAQFARPGGKVSVRVVCEFGRNVVTIEDNGIGIPESELSQLGNKFFRSTRSQAAELSGQGLGFAVAKNLIDMQDGAIAVNSDDLGTTVVVQLGATGRW